MALLETSASPPRLCSLSAECTGKKCDTSCVFGPYLPLVQHLGAVIVGEIPEEPIVARKHELQRLPCGARAGCTALVLRCQHRVGRLGHAFMERPF